MQVEMWNCLAGLGSVVDAQIERIRSMLLNHQPTRVVGQTEHFVTLRGRCVEP